MLNEESFRITSSRKDVAEGNCLLVLADSTMVEFTEWRENRILNLSSSGGGLFGRPVILTNPGRS